MSLLKQRMYVTIEDTLFLASVMFSRRGQIIVGRYAPHAHSDDVYMALCCAVMRNLPSRIRKQRLDVQLFPCSAMSQGLEGITQAVRDREYTKHRVGGWRSQEEFDYWFQIVT